MTAERADRPAVPAGGGSGEAEVGLRLASRILRAVEPVSRRAKSFVGLFGVAGALSLLSAVAVVFQLFLPFEAFAWWKVVGTVFLLALLAIPGVTLILFRLALLELVNLPERIASASTELSETSRETYASISAPAGGRLSRLLKLIQSIAQLRAVLMESREVLVGGTLVLRVANPIVLVAVLASLVISGLLIMFAAIAGAVAIL